MGFEFFLGGQDLEMATIRQLLESQSARLHDHRLSWGARASAYRQEIAAAHAAGHMAVLIELQNDLGLSLGGESPSTVLIDHHGDRAGQNQQTSLEQVFELLELPAESWSRELALVAANDRGHTRGMRELNASDEELRRIRAADRAAQGITADDEALGRTAVAQAEIRCGGKLTVVQLAHRRAATVTDALDVNLGGVGFENLIVFCPGQTLFYGSGRVIEHLKSRVADGWWGGELPERGFWGCARNVPSTEFIDWCESTLNTKPAESIDVRTFHHTLLWPLLIRGAEKEFSEFTKKIGTAGWKEVTSVPGPVDQAFGYSEMVYFHPFVRDFLFGDGDSQPEERTLRRWTRATPDQVTVTLALEPAGSPPLEIDLQVERLELLLIRPRIALLLVEVSNRKNKSPAGTDPTLGDARTPLTLAQVLQLQSRLRHIYPPYFDEQGRHGDCPTAVTWKPGGTLTPPSACATDSPQPQFDAFTRQGAEPPMYAHWQVLFGNQIKPFQAAKNRRDGGLYLQQLLDDRMPTMSFIAVDRPSEIEQEDEDRFPALDPPGLTYDLAFRATRRDSFRYTRFRHWGTTYYCNGTSFTMTCNAGSFSNLLLTHFRRHYTHLAIIAQYQHAALLYFADELADIAKRLPKSDESEATQEAWKDQIRALQHRFLKFRTRSYFTEVSNQIQAKDLFSLWYEQLGTRALFERVSQTNTEVYEAVENDEMKQLTRGQHRLAEIATLGLAVSIGLTTMGTVFAWLSLFGDATTANPAFAGAPITGPWIWLIPALAITVLTIFAIRSRHTLALVRRWIASVEVDRR